MSARASRSIVAAAAAIGLVASVGLFAIPRAHAQSTDLKTSIRQALAADPRAASLPPAQIEEMATILSAQAASQGITAEQVSGSYTPPAPACSGAMCLLQMFSDTGALLLLVLGILGAIAIILAAVHEYKLHVRRA